MSIKLRLILSNLAMIIIPIILFFFASFLLVIVFLGDFREMAQFLPESHQHHQTIQEDTVMFNELKEKSARNPKMLLNETYLDSLSERLIAMETGLIIRKDGEVYYTTDDLLPILAEDLPIFGTETSFQNLEPVGEQIFSIKQHDFFMPDGGEISLFLMKDARPWIQFVKTFFPILFGILLFILVATNGLLSYFVSRSIIQPINHLKTAANTIKKGNLEHSILTARKDEIGQLTQAFEEMRIQLYESEQLQKQYEENRKELIASISHDLKTPITAIKGYIEGIKDGVADTPEKRAHYMQTIYTKAVDMDHLINELFLFSKLDLGKVPFHFERVDIKDYLIDYIEELNFDLHKQNVQIDFQYDPKSHYPIHMDREKFKRVLSNIVNNSLKYMDKEEKNLSLFLDNKHDEITLRIEDNGPGIPQDSLPFIFDQFYRAERSRNKLTGGSGLGLSIAKMIVQEHHGKIQAESKLTVGTKITITLPYLSQQRRLPHEKDTNH